MNDPTALLVSGIILVVLLGGYLLFERSSMGPKEIALLGTLSAFAAISRVPFAAIPNVQPTTFLVALTGYVFGPYQGFLAGSTAALISNVFLGQGPWTPWQMFAWGLVGALTGILGKRFGRMTPVSFALVCFAYGFLFDWIMNLWFVLGSIRPLTPATVFLAYLSGISMDVFHAGGNFLFAILFFENFRKVLLRFKKRLQTTYLKNPMGGTTDETD